MESGHNVTVLRRVRCSHQPKYDPSVALNISVFENIQLVILLLILLLLLLFVLVVVVVVVLMYIVFYAFKVPIK